MNDARFILSEEDELQIGKPADFSFKKLTELQKMGVEGARDSRTAGFPAKNDKDKFLTRGLWLNNNKLTSIKNLPLTVESVLAEPSLLAWLDCSFNYITNVDKDILKYPNLIIVYFHGNQISELGEIAKLRHLPKLRSLTFHGNPVAEHPKYRAFVVAILPQLVNLDFGPITKSDRMNPAPPEVVRKLAASESMMRQYSLMQQQNG